MGFKCGIVGLPNVGKSTLFNALTQTAAAQAANYPFCTIEPNVGEVAVPDLRLDALAKIAKSAQLIPTRLTFVDIAGLVRGASKGEGLGNQFLSHIREVDAVAYVVRCFDDGDITHVENRIDPVADAETVETELMLSDLDSLERRLPAVEKKAKQGDKESKIQADVMQAALVMLREGKPARLVKVTDEQRPVFEQLQLLTSKPVVYVANVDEGAAATGNAYTKRVEERAKSEGAAFVVISAKIEAELSGLDAEERQASHQHACHRACLEGHVKAAGQRLGCGLRRAHVGAHRDVHADEAGEAGQHRTDQKAEGDLLAEQEPEPDQQHDADACDGDVLALEIGLRAFGDRARDFLHALVAGVTLHDIEVGPDSVKERGRSKCDDDEQWAHGDVHPCFLL
jgi:GTP-binding protein YchF